MTPWDPVGLPIDPWDAVGLPLTPWAETDISVSKLLGFETFANFLKGFGFGLGEFGFGKKSQFWFRKIWSRKKSLGFGFEEVGVRKKSRFRFRRIWSRKKGFVLENLVSKKSHGFGFGKLEFGKEKSKKTRKTLDQVNSAYLLFEF